MLAMTSQIDFDHFQEISTFLARTMKNSYRTIKNFYYMYATTAVVTTQSMENDRLLFENLQSWFVLIDITGPL